ncbi:MAG: alpha-L-fucosidase [Caldilineaceae bacterium]
MQERTLHLSDRVAHYLDQRAEDEDTTPSEIANYLISRAMQQSSWQPAIVRDRGQRAGAQNDPRLDWWRAAKFGLFIHWGLYAIPAGEWEGRRIPGISEWIMQHAEIPVADYAPLTRQFNPVQFDAAAWVALAKRAGQQYIVITSKHHDGFCLFKSHVTDYNIVDATPFGRDVLKELADECARQDMKLGFYYSQTQDWYHPDGDGNFWDYDEDAKDFAGYIETYVKAQVRELLTNYGPVAVLWFDTPKRITEAQSRELLALCHELQPDCLVCGRLGNGLGDYASAGDNRIPDAAEAVDWETPATINDSWGFKHYDHNWKSSADLIRKLVDIVSKGGNYLLNVGPTAEGVIPAPSVERLEAMGAWLAVNGESIYGPPPVRSKVSIGVAPRRGRVKSICMSLTGRPTACWTSVSRMWRGPICWPTTGRPIFRLPARERGSRCARPIPRRIPSTPSSYSNSNNIVIPNPSLRADSGQ